MKKWEYTKTFIENGAKRQIEHFDEMGRNNWELCCFEILNDVNKGRIYYWKKEINETQK